MTRSVGSTSDTGLPPAGATGGQVAARMAAHLLLSVFVARANDELFQGFIKWEEKHGTYQDVIALHGHAPDQYRLLPLLPLAFFERLFRYRVALMALNFAAVFVCLELFAWMLRHRPARERLTFSVVFSGVALYSLFPGWRPDTFSLLALCTLYFVPLVAFPVSGKRSALMVAATATIAFARADVAFAYGIFLQSRRRLSLWARPLVLLLPLAVQALLSKVLFPQATYYMKVWTLSDNLSFRLIARTSGTYLVLALLVSAFGATRRWLADAWRFDRPMLLAAAVYLGAVVCMGRVNEYRLFLPFIPMLLVVDRERFERGAETAEARLVARSEPAVAG